jgi:hypothetical protein
MVQRPSAAAGRPESRHPLQFLFFFSPPPPAQRPVRAGGPPSALPSTAAGLPLLDLLPILPPVLDPQRRQPPASRPATSPTAGSHSTMLSTVGFQMHSVSDRWPSIRPSP